MILVQRLLNHDIKDIAAAFLSQHCKDYDLRMRCDAMQRPCRSMLHAVAGIRQGSGMADKQIAKLS